MAENSKIEWTDHTFNPWIGCTKVSAACDHCYAEVATPTRTLRASGAETWGPHAPRKRTSAANWKKPLAWNRKAEAEGRRYRVFCASLADVGDNHHTILREWRDDLMNMVERTPHLDWLFLTKRPQNIPRLYPEWMAVGEWPANVWLGTTVENQTEADRRIPHLLAVPAAVRFLSVEPMLGPVDLTEVAQDRPDLRAKVILDPLNGIGGFKGPCPRIHWVICGGESGPGARPMHPDWARSLRDQCVAAGVAFHFKKWGEHEADQIGPEDARSVYYPPGHVIFRKVGKRAAGRLLDGRTWDELPGVSNG